MVHSISGWMRGVQVKLWDPLRTRALPERLRDVFTTRRYTNPRLPLPLPLPAHTLRLYTNSASTRRATQTKSDIQILTRSSHTIRILEKFDINIPSTFSIKVGYVSQVPELQKHRNGAGKCSSLFGKKIFPAAPEHVQQEPTAVLSRWHCGHRECETSLSDQFTYCWQINASSCKDAKVSTPFFGLGLTVIGVGLGLVLIR